jgi:hypothetical protein
VRVQPFLQSSVNARLRRDLLSRCRRRSGRCGRAVVELDLALGVDPGQRVLAPVLVVAAAERPVDIVLAGVRAAAFLARFRATTVVMAQAIRFSSSSVSIRSEFQISERSVTLRSASCPRSRNALAALLRASPACGRRRRPPAWSSASRRSSAVGVRAIGVAQPSKRVHDLVAGRLVDVRARR